jgi:hypothetical protein
VGILKKAAKKIDKILQEELGPKPPKNPNGGK